MKTLADLRRRITRLRRLKLRVECALISAQRELRRQKAAAMKLTRNSREGAQ